VPAASQPTASADFVEAPVYPELLSYSAPLPPATAATPDVVSAASDVTPVVAKPALPTDAAVMPVAPTTGSDVQAQAATPVAAGFAPVTEAAVLLSAPVEPTAGSDVQVSAATPSSADADLPAAVVTTSDPVEAMADSQVVTAPAVRTADPTEPAITIDVPLSDTVASTSALLPIVADVPVMALTEPAAPAIVLMAPVADQPDTPVSTGAASADIVTSDNPDISPLLVAAVTTTVAASPSVFWMDNTAALMAIQDPIMLPSFTLPGDETSALMLPAAAEISHLPQDFAAAVRRLTERGPAIVTFIDPVTGQLVNPASAQAQQPVMEPAWLLVDTASDDNPGALSSRIHWDSHPT
jgi:hypothetical protein